MTLMQEQAMDLIKRMPDEKIYYLINLLEGIVEATPVYKGEPTDSQRAYQNLQKFRRRGTEDRDYKAELYAALEEKYEGIDSVKIVAALKNSVFSDLEDCLQSDCAKRIKADYVVTRNMKDFGLSEVPAILPEDFLKVAQS